MIFLLTLAIFGTAMFAMAIGLVLSGRVLRGSCGGPEVLDAHGNPLSCGTCPKKEVDLCPSDDLLIQMAQIGHPDPKHHR